MALFITNRVRVIGYISTRIGQTGSIDPSPGTYFWVIYIYLIYIYLSLYIILKRIETLSLRKYAKGIITIIFAFKNENT